LKNGRLCKPLIKGFCAAVMFDFEKKNGQQRFGACRAEASRLAGIEEPLNGIGRRE
jgi:hypothetical protein